MISVLKKQFTFNSNQPILSPNFFSNNCRPVKRDKTKQLVAPIAVKTQHNGKPNGQHPNSAPLSKF